MDRPSRIRRARLPVVAALVAVFALLALAGPVAGGDFRSGDTIVVAAGERVSDDLYVSGGTVIVDGTVDGDLTVVAGTVRVAGEVTGSVNVAGGTVDVLGSVGNAVRVGGGTVTVAGDVARDLVAFGGTVTLTPSGQIGGDVAGAAGAVGLAGSVTGDVLVGAGTLEIGGAVDGRVDASVDQLTIGPNATIDGDVTYTSANEASVASGAQVGELTRREPDPRPEGAALFDENPLVAAMGMFLGLLVVGLVLMLLWPRLVIGSGEALRRSPLLGLGAGCATWLGLAVLAVLLFVLAVLLGNLGGSIGGAFAFPGIIVLVVFILLVMVADVPVVMTIGGVLLSRVATSPYLAYAAGAAVYTIVLSLALLLHGLLGLLLYLATLILGAGAFTLLGWQARRGVVVTPAGAATAEAETPPA